MITLFTKNVVKKKTLFQWFYFFVSFSINYKVCRYLPTYSSPKSCQFPRKIRWKISIVCFQIKKKPEIFHKLKLLKIFFIQKKHRINHHGYQLVVLEKIIPNGLKQRIKSRSFIYIGQTAEKIYVGSDPSKICKMNSCFLSTYKVRKLCDRL